MPEFAFLSGRIGKVKEFGETFLKFRWALWEMPSKYITITQNMLDIGIKYPNLNNQELDYLEQLASSPETFEITEDILCDKDLLPREITILTKTSLNLKNDSFNESFLDKIVRCFETNEELDDYSEPMFVYDRTHNKIIKNMYENIGLGEFIITCTLRANEYFQRVECKFGKEFADFCVKATCGSEDPEIYRVAPFYSLKFNSITSLAENYYHDKSKVQQIKREVALMWLEDINAIEYD